MKKFLGAMAFVFAVLAVILYTDSIRDVAGFKVANIQETVFCAACVIHCVMNIIGAIIITCIEGQNGNVNDQSANGGTQSKATESIPSSNAALPTDNEANIPADPAQKPDKENAPSAAQQDPNVIYASESDKLFCDICGIRKKLNKVMLNTRKGPQEKKICDNCKAQNKDKLV